MWGEVLRHEYPSRFDVIEALDADPQRFGPRLAIALAAKKASEAGHHVRGFSQRGRLFRRRRLLLDETIQSLSLRVFKENRRRHIGGLASELGQLKDAPR